MRPRGGARRRSRGDAGQWRGRSQPARAGWPVAVAEATAAASAAAHGAGDRRARGRCGDGRVGLWAHPASGPSSRAHRRERCARSRRVARAGSRPPAVGWASRGAPRPRRLGRRGGAGRDAQMGSGGDARSSRACGPLGSPAPAAPAARPRCRGVTTAGPGRLRPSGGGARGAASGRCLRRPRGGTPLRLGTCARLDHMLRATRPPGGRTLPGASASARGPPAPGRRHGRAAPEPRTGAARDGAPRAAGIAARRPSTGSRLGGGWPGVDAPGWSSGVRRSRQVDSAGAGGATEAARPPAPAAGVAQREPRTPAGGLATRQAASAGRPQRSAPGGPGRPARPARPGARACATTPGEPRQRAPERAASPAPELRRAGVAHDRRQRCRARSWRGRGAPARSSPRRRRWTPPAVGPVHLTG